MNRNVGSIIEDIEGLHEDSQISYDEIEQLFSSVLRIRLEIHKGLVFEKIRA